MNFKETLEAAPKIIGIFSFLVLVLTIVHEWGYFTILGSHLQTISSTFDYFANALIWLPSTLGFVSYIQILDETIVRDGPSAVKIKKAFYWHAGLGAALLFVGILINPSPIFNALLVVGYASIWFLVKVVPFKTFEGRLWLYKSVLSAPMLLLLSYGYGASSAYSDLRKTTDIYAVTSKDKPEDKRQLIMLRSFEKGILVHDRTAHRIEFLRWDNVGSLSRFATADVGVGYSCTWFGIMCRNMLEIVP